MSDVLETPLLIIEQACKYIQLSEATLARMRKNGTGPKFVKMGARIFYRKIDLDEYIQNATTNSNTI
jgi:predicted DNA-binding transcriptional regulator AlpA